MTCDDLRAFNAPGGAAHTTAGDLAQTALSEAVTLRPADAITRFNDCARAARAVTLPGQSTISYPVVGSAPLAAVADVALYPIRLRRWRYWQVAQHPVACCLSSAEFQG